MVAEFLRKSVSFNKSRTKKNNILCTFIKPLARLGASILGIDAVSENISTAEYHADPSLKENLRYQHGKQLLLLFFSIQIKFFIR